MTAFKRKRPKNRRAGCLLCKGYKANGAPVKDMYRMGELRKLGSRRRMTRHGAISDEP